MKRREEVPTRSDWLAGIYEAWNDEPCPSCGWCHGVDHVDEDGTVWTHCHRSGKSYALAREYPPARFAPEPITYEDLPF